MQTRIKSTAWLLRNIFKNPIEGILELKARRLSFVTGEGPVFDVGIADVSDIRFPWYYCRGGVKLKAAGVQYRFSFFRPNTSETRGARFVGTSGGPAGGVASLVLLGAAMSGMGGEWRTSGAWRKALKGLRDSALAGG